MGGVRQPYLIAPQAGVARPPPVGHAVGRGQVGIGGVKPHNHDGVDFFVEAGGGGPFGAQGKLVGETLFLVCVCLCVCVVLSVKVGLGLGERGWVVLPVFPWA